LQQESLTHLRVELAAAVKDVLGPRYALREASNGTRDSSSASRLRRSLLRFKLLRYAINNKVAGERKRERYNAKEGDRESCAQPSGWYAVEGVGKRAQAPLRSPRSLRSEKLYPTPRTVNTKRGLFGSGSTLSRKWLTCTLIVFSSPAIAAS